jgi:Xaa-Pro aminopeptidase
MLNLKEFSKRRQHFIEKMGPDSIAIFSAAPECYRNGDVHYAYRQNSDFYYLTGFPEPEAIAVLITEHHASRFILFNRPRDKTAELWNGKRAGQEGAREIYLADASYDIHEFKAKLPSLLEGKKKMYYTYGHDKALDHEMTECLNYLRSKSRSGVAVPAEIVETDFPLHELRLIKSESEIELMRKAAAISSVAHARAMKVCRPGMKEYELEAEILYEFTRQGSRAPAYECIVGAGENSCILHYRDNQAEMRDGEVVLIDAGCEYDHYASDITRTFPVNGRFSPEQREVYEVVLRAQLKAIEQVKPGNTADQVHETAVKEITAGLVKLGLLKGSVEKLIERNAHTVFYMHHTGHWLGMDVHDVGTYRFKGKARPLQAGMVLTVEPGIYIAAGMKGVDERWWNIGVRIEDDVLVTHDGCEVLSTAPKEIADIENIMAGKG